MERIEGLVKDVQKQVSIIVEEQVSNTKSAGQFIHTKFANASSFIKLECKVMKDLVEQHSEEKPVNMMLQKVYEETKNNISTVLMALK